MKELGFTNAEFAKLTEAQNNSDGLVWTETVAMNSIKGLFADRNGKFTIKKDPDPVMAAKMMHDLEYHSNKKTIMEPINDFFKLLDIRTQSSVTKYEKNSNILLVSIIIIFAILIGFIIFYYLVISLKVVNPIKSITDHLKNSTIRISSSSMQLEGSSQSIAQGATNQASSIEETSASMEELSSMVKQNVTNSRQANSLAQKAKSSSENGYQRMKKLQDSMTDLGDSSDKIKKVIKVIDDIAFQTNILALNAAVEAARAGEAGMGFAVVADEVKNLANKSADAANNTAEMIEESLIKIKNGQETTNELGEVYLDIVQKTKDVGDMVAEVEAASQQQDKGIDQVNRAIVQLDEVVQMNATAAEDSALAATDLKGQANTLINIVKQVISIMSGANAVRLIEKEFKTITDNNSDVTHKKIKMK